MSSLSPYERTLQWAPLTLTQSDIAQRDAARYPSLPAVVAEKVDGFMSSSAMNPAPASVTRLTDPIPLQPDPRSAAMKIANPFASGPVPSRIALGTGSFGSGIPREVAFAAMDAYLEAGGNILDTANIYSSWEPGGVGASERTVGDWLRSRKARDRIILGTKGGHPELSSMNRSRCTLDELRWDFAESLDRLQVDRVDIYWLHRDHPGMPVAAIMDNLAELDHSKRLGCFGASNWMPARIEAANAYAQKAGLKGFTANQPGWSLAAHATHFADASPMLYVDDATLDWHTRTGLALMSYSSQAAGYFGESNVQWARSGFQGAAPRGASHDTPANRLRLQRAMTLAERKRCTANQVALAWLLHQPFPTFPIIGSRSPAHIRESMGALQVQLDPDECRWLAATGAERDPSGQPS